MIKVETQEKIWEIRWSIYCWMWCFKCTMDMLSTKRMCKRLSLHCMNTVRTQCNLSCPYQVCTASMKTILGSCLVGTTSMPLFPHPYWALTASWFDHVLTTFFWTCLKFTHVSQDHKDQSHLYRYLLHSFYIIQICTASDQFFIDVVETWSSVTGV